MTSQDAYFYRRKQTEAGEANVRITDLKAGIKWMLLIRLETSEVFVE